MKASKFTKGRFHIEISLPHAKGVSRKIEFSADHTLADIHDNIQRTFNFDNDHKYAFFLDYIPFSNNGYHDHRDKEFTEGPFSDEVMLGELSWNIGDKILYLFDFGDNWLFDVVLIDINEQAGALMVPKIIESKGTPPPQYDNIDDDDAFGYDEEDFDTDDDTFYDAED